ncbi:MAG: endopeptidase La [Bacteroidota bacterium]
MSAFEKDNITFQDVEGQETEMIPLLSSEEEDQLNKEPVPEDMPILPLRNNVLFPGVVIPITVGRDKSIQLIKDTYNQGDKTIGVVAQKDVNIEDPEEKDLNRVGTVARILKVLQMPDGNTTAIIQGKKRFKIQEITQKEPYFRAKGEEYEESYISKSDEEFNALIDSLRDLSLDIIKKSPNLPSDASFAIKNIESPTFLVNFVASNLSTDVQQKQKYLETSDIFQRASDVLEVLSNELQKQELKNKIQDKVKTDLDKQQRDYFLNQQLKTIQEELGGNPNEQAINELKKKAENKDWPQEAKEAFEKEVAKLNRMNPAVPEYSIQLNYLEFMTDLPWNEISDDNLKLKQAEKVLDEDHYGLEKVKERILEHLAVLKLKQNNESPILCLVGPPGVGKTSLGRSVARALNRSYVRMSLGGLRDEAEIRGHRKTYIGAMPGRIMSNIKKAKTSNPVFVLDEIDKVSGNTISGDPSSALLEVLDPEQNNEFYDNYLEINYDLSRVLFIATANTLSSVHPALRDRLEVIDISGYLVEEKVEICKRHLIPKQLERHGVKKNQVTFRKNIIERIIEGYTREAGVRMLEKHVASVIRSKAKYIATGEDYNKVVSKEDLTRILGPRKISRNEAIQIETPGVVTGLAWTAFGGEILFVESSLSRGKGNLTLTGNLGTVMKESANLAFEYLKSHTEELDINPDIFKYWNVHIHVPEGATPKDGPSAGVTIFTALASIFTQRKIKTKTAMTGEITLRGKVLPVGGIKEKILAAKRAKITDIIISSENEKDINDIPEKYIKGLKFHYVDEMIEVVDLALHKNKVKDAMKLDRPVLEKNQQQVAE